MYVNNSVTTSRDLRRFNKLKPYFIVVIIIIIIIIIIKTLYV